MSAASGASAECGVRSAEQPIVNLVPRTSPALRERSHHYPVRFLGKVPLRIVMLKTVHPDLGDVIPAKPGTVLVKDQIYECWVNSHGAVVGICLNGARLGVKPDEFEVMEWHPQTAKFQVHVLGPDEFYPMGDELEALRHANALNREIAAQQIKHAIDENWPWAMAVVEKVEQEKTERTENQAV